ncbi:primosomal protein N' [Dethiothermospora halolimnae]|uniref:primosomal protein N' n=1 Tax=Dethiothermospora halolimnae TaxID=3114390 RepID=UPI003CCC458D
MKNRLMVEIIVDNKSRNTDRVYTYIVPDKYIEEIKLGTRVIVPFGRGNRKLEGIIINIKKNCGIEKNKLKAIEAIIDDVPILSENLLRLGIWMKNKYLCQYIDVFKTIMPSGITKKIKRYIKMKKGIEYSFIKTLSSDNEKKIVGYLCENGDSDITEVKKNINISNINKSLNNLEERGIIEIYEKITSDVNKRYQKCIVKLFNTNEMDIILQKISDNAFKQKEIIEYLEDKQEVLLSEVKKALSTSLSTVKSLEKKGYIKIIDKEVKRNAISKKIPEYNRVKLNEAQKNCIEEIYSDVRGKNENKFLIHGVTGSGKTEIYLGLIDKMLEENKQSIVLVPEISLTPQTVERFAGRFKNRVAVLHSRLSLGERFDEWRKIKDGKVDIVVGARSAIFAPFKRLGLIIIDEEHESSYKSSMNPKYDAIEVAEKRCEIEGASLVLGSATPSINTYHRAKKGEIKLFTLLKRANNKPLPPITVIDMKNELDKGNKSIFSTRLYDAIKFNLEKGKQTILFLNRRGFSTFVSCRKCGYVAKCNKCDISLTYHKNRDLLKCHYCGLSMKAPVICPDCGSKYIKYFGIGTQRIEEMVRKYFPNASVARMDVDTTARKGSHEKILSKVKNGEVDILIGTQMISKGLDFPNVTLVGIIAADMSLNLPDFKASERTFQLATQVGGRAGRGADEGQAILQTYEPEHYSIMNARFHDYVSFYDEEILIRKEFQYPPFINIINIVVSGKEEKKVANETAKLVFNLKKEIKIRHLDFDVKKLLGPNPAPISKIKNKYRWQVIIKCSDFEINEIKSIIYDICLNNNKFSKSNDLKYNVDINPNSLI